jgi:hypothetical protein
LNELGLMRGVQKKRGTIVLAVMSIYVVDFAINVGTVASML